MFQWLVPAVAFLAAMLDQPSSPPQILQIYRDTLTPEADAAYRKIEEDVARVCRELGCPHPYLAIETLTGPKEVWYLNGYESVEEQAQVAADYVKNGPLMAALGRVVTAKADLVGTPVELFASYRADVSHGRRWAMEGRLLVITQTSVAPPPEGTVFEAADGTRFVIDPARTRNEADAKVKAAGPEARLFAVRPTMSMPADEWIAADPAFWNPDSPAEGGR